jgi:hypothetical protein
MKKSFNIMAITVAAALMVMAGVGGAEMVDIGMGSMDRSEFEALKGVMGGGFQAFSAGSTAPTAADRVAEFSRSDVDAIGQVMAATFSTWNVAVSESKSQTVDIGTGSMSTGEFCGLSKLVASNRVNPSEGYASICQ